MRFESSAVRITPHALALLSLLVVTTGCGDSSGVSPDQPPAAVGGPWAGVLAVTVENVASSHRSVQPVSVTITQSDGSLTGEFTGNGFSGAFAGAVSGNDISGTLTLRGSDGCAATAMMTGLVDDPELQLYVAWIGGDPCRWGGNLRMNLRRP